MNRTAGCHLFHGSTRLLAEKMSSMRNDGREVLLWEVGRIVPLVLVEYPFLSVLEEASAVEAPEGKLQVNRNAKRTVSEAPILLKEPFRPEVVKCLSFKGAMVSFEPFPSLLRDEITHHNLNIFSPNQPCSAPEEAHSTPFPPHLVAVLTRTSKGAAAISPTLPWCCPTSPTPRQP